MFQRLANSAPCLIGLLLLVATGQVHAAEFEVTGTDEHTWFLLPSPETSEEELPWSLAHHGVREDPLVYRPVRRFSNKPTAMASLGDRFWITLPAKPDRRDIIPVRVLRIEWNSSIDRYLAAPRAGLDLLPNIETDPENPGRPIDLVASPEGPAVLLEHEPGQYSLQRLRRGRWEAVTLPKHPQGQSLRLGLADQSLILLGEEDGMLSVWWETTDGWAQPVRHPESGPLVNVATVGDRFVVGTKPGPGEIALAFIQPDGLARLGGWKEPEGAWRILGTQGQLRLVRDADQLESSRIDLMTGKQGPWTAYVPGSPMGMSPWPLFLAVGASILVILFLIRGRVSTELADGVLPLAALPRLLALWIDAVPGLIVLMIWHDAKPRLLLEAFTFSLDAQGWGLYAILVLITCAWSLGWELAVNTSPGKALMGGCVRRVDGESPTWGPLVLRSLIKFLLLMVPILMITALRPPALQSPGDQVTGLMVGVRATGSDQTDPGP